MPWAAALFDALPGDTIQPVDVEGAVGWVAAGDTDTTTPGYGGVRLLPDFDAYPSVGVSIPAIGCSPAARVSGHSTALSGRQLPALLIHGVVAGVWHQRRSGRRLAVTVEPLTPLSAPHRRRELDAEVERVWLPSSTLSRTSPSAP